MAFCANCGANVTDGSKFCPTCGQRVPVAPGPDAGSENRQGGGEPDYRTSPESGGENSRQRDNANNYQGYRYGPHQGHDYGQQQGYGQQGYGQQGYGQQGYGYGQQQGYGNYAPPPMYQNLEQDAADNRLISVLCYFGIFLLIPLLARPGSQYARFHSNQGLVLLLFGIVISVVGIIPILGWIVAIVGGVFSFICWIIGLVNVLGGKLSPLPLIGKIVILK